MEMGMREGQKGVGICCYDYDALSDWLREGSMV